MAILTLTDQPQESQHTLAESLIEKFGLTPEHESLAHTAMLALIAQANLSGQANQKDYAERLAGFFQHYQALVKELHKLAERV